MAKQNGSKLSKGDSVRLWDLNYDGTEWFQQDTVKLIAPAQFGSLWGDPAASEPDTLSALCIGSPAEKEGPWEMWMVRFPKELGIDPCPRWVRAEDRA